MSIPPLVCSTPPPPEQCEDDKDHEDFDISYNLSQDEDDDDDDSNEYTYGNYSPYNIYQTSSENIKKDKWNTNLNNVSEDKSEQEVKSEERVNGVNFITNHELVKENISKFEDCVVEDLNLIVNKDIVHSNDIASKEFETEVDVEIESSENQPRIQDEGGTNISIINENPDLCVSSVINELNIPNKNNNLDNKTEEINIDSVKNITSGVEISLVDELSDNVKIETVENAFTENAKPVYEDSVIEVQDESLVDDDFGDFEDFKFSSTSENCQVLPVNSENPWESDCNVGPEFGDFTANFDVNVTKPTVEIVTNAISCEKKDQTNTCLEDDNDDFGDFDDFRSSDNTEPVADTNEVTSAPDVPLWNLSSPGNDLVITDSINTMLTSIFAKEIPAPENELFGKLETFLRETWGHLIDIEVRQPYMINWNNSLGQKTLLKALCIDSRNILFGPKWNYNMPKYAVNLTAAPLQPQKQSVPSSSSTTESTEKSANKEAGTWVDPFTPDGQESCNSETKSMPTETVNRPTDLEVFESDVSTKLSKIYSSTINVQPLRHINLPDTHIFTPTDSETPRSKTIHYDSGPSSLITQAVPESDKNQAEILPSQLNETVQKEYWDFQDFKGATTIVPPMENTTRATEETVANNAIESVITKPSMTYQTQILQPIKLDPIMPTLNWPDPGEVKETFDDFSDFISNTSWNNDKENHVAVALEKQKDHQNLQNPKEEDFTVGNVDDEFETFQSAPVITSATDFSFNTAVGSKISLPENLSMQTVENCDNPSVKVDTKKSNCVILENQNSPVSNNISDMQNFNFPQTTPAIQNISTDILQPTSSSSTGLRHQHKSDQILQPLSLESYSQINWPNPGIDLQDLSRFNPINSLHSLKNDSTTVTSGNSKNSSPAHNSGNNAPNQTVDDDIWGDFVSSAPKQQHPTPKKTTFADDEEWTDFVSSPSMKPQNGLNTISFNVHTNLSMQKSSSQNNFGPRNNQIPLEIPTLNYITPKSSHRGIYSEKHLQNL